MSCQDPAMLRLIEEDGTVSAVYMIPGDRSAPERVEPVHPPWVHDSNRATWKCLDRYAEWRKTKCRPVNPLSVPERFDDLNNATHQFVGEVAEAVQLIYQHGSDCFRAAEESRMELIGEIGDIFFTGSWLGDAWGRNPLLEVEQFDASHVLGLVRIYHAENMRGKIVGLADRMVYPTDAWVDILRMAMKASFEAGLLCNTFKKLRYQGRPQSQDRVVNSIKSVLEWAAQMAVIADATVMDCLAHNIQKLDHRFPSGYQPGSGGGNRTGVGA